MLFNECNPFIRFAAQIECTKSFKSDVYSCDHRLFYSLNGKGRIRIDRAVYNLDADTAIIFPSGTPYRILCSDSFQLISVNFDYTQDHHSQKSYYATVSPTHYRQEFCLERVHFPDADCFNQVLYIKNAYYMKKNLLNIIEEKRLQRMFYAEKISTLFRELLCEIARTENESTNDTNKKINIIISFIQENYCLDITNADIAGLIHYTPYYVNKLMLAYTGMTLHRYLTNYRLAVAEEKLLSTEESITAIALDTGFNNTSYFSGCFKKKYGSNPHEFRKKHKNIL